MDFFFLFKEWCHGGQGSFPVVMDCEGLPKDLVIQKRWVELLYLPDHVVDGMVPDVVKCDIDRDPSMDR